MRTMLGRCYLTQDDWHESLGHFAEHIAAASACDTEELMEVANAALYSKTGVDVTESDRASFLVRFSHGYLLSRYLQARRLHARETFTPQGHEQRKA